MAPPKRLHVQRKSKTAIRLCQSIPLAKPIFRRIENYRLNSPDALIYIHIGKCGGSSLWRAIRKSKTLRKEFKTVKKLHLRKPLLLPKARYLIVIRNPIQRAISAFNWRYHRVIVTEEREARLGERDTFMKYKTLNALAEALYTDGQLNDQVAREFKTINHLKKDISFYLSDLLTRLKEEQLFGVCANETLDEDIKRQLGFDTVPRIHEYAPFVPDEKKKLSDLAYGNLKTFLKQDYACLETLLDMKQITLASRDRLLR